MKTDRYYALAIVVCLTFAFIACNKKNNSENIITERVEQPKPQDPVSQQPYTDSRDVQWIGRTYHIALNRQANDSLPMVKDEIGQQFVDNTITLVVSRQDGSIFYSREFTKKDFEKYIDEDYRKTGILEGLVFDKADGDWLEFAASVSHPQTDEYIPLIVRLSRMGVLDIKRDAEMDTNAFDEKEEESI